MGRLSRPGALRAYIATVTIVGLAAIAASVAGLPQTPRPLEYVLVAGCALLTGKFRIKIASVHATISVSDTFFITAALLFGPGPATVALAVDSAVISWRLHHSADR